MPGTASANDTEAAPRHSARTTGAGHTGAPAQPGRSAVIRDQAMHDVVHILVAHLETRRRTCGVGRRTLSPTEYAEQCIGFRASGVAGGDQQSVAACSPIGSSNSEREARSPARPARFTSSPSQPAAAACERWCESLKKCYRGGFLGGRRPPMTSTWTAASCDPGDLQSNPRLMAPR